MSEAPLGLWLDIQTTQNPPPHIWRGIPRYVSGHAAALLKRKNRVRRLALNPLLPYPAALDPELAGSGLLTWSTSRDFRQALAEGPTAFYVMSPFEMMPLSESVLPPFAMKAGIPLVTTMYDLIPLLRPKHYLDKDRASRYLSRLEVIKQADMILAISDHTRQDCIDHLGLDPERVATIGAGVSGYFRPSQPGEDPWALIRRQLPSLCRPFVLSVLGAEERKNTERLIQAYASLPQHLRSELQLVIACQLNERYFRLWTEISERWGLAPGDLVFTDLIADPVLRALYQSCELFVFPSLYEGFGLPAAEAAACGAPVVTSSTSSLPEVLDHPPATFDPKNVGAMARMIERAVCDSRFSNELRLVARARAPIHSWEAVAQRTTEALKNLSLRSVARPRAGAGSWRPRLGFAGSFGATTLFGRYDLRVARALQSKCDLDIFTTESSGRRTFAGERDFRVFPLEALHRSINPAAYDTIVYIFDDTDQDKRLSDIAGAYPGIAWMHDVAPSRAGDGLLRPILASARAVVADSTAAAAVLQLHWRLNRESAHISVIPLAPAAVGANRQPSGIPLVAASPSKRCEDAAMVLDAFIRLFRIAPSMLAFLAPMAEEKRRCLKRRADEQGIGEYVLFPDVSIPEEYAGWLSRAAVAVDITTAETTRSSTLVVDALAARVPVITNLISFGRSPPGGLTMLSGEASPAALAEALQKTLNRPQVSAIAPEEQEQDGTFLISEVADAIIGLSGLSPKLPSFAPRDF